MAVQIEAVSTTWGQVTFTAPLTVLFAGSTQEAVVTLRLSSYTPAVGDKVAVTRIGKSWAVLGKLVAV